MKTTSLLLFCTEAGFAFLIGRCGGAPRMGIAAFETRFFAVLHCRSLRGHTFCVNRKYAKNHTGRGCFDSPSPCEPSPATTEVGLRSPFWNPLRCGAMFNIADRLFCKDKFGAKNGGTPPPNTFRQNGMSVLPFVYFRQTQCKEIVEVILLSN